MTEQQPVEQTPATPEAGSPAETPRTAEQVEQEYKARLSGKDKAHAAETDELRRQLSAAQKTGTSAATEGEQATATAEDLKKQLAAEQKARQEDKQGFDAQLRTTKYPYAAEALDPTALATMDEAKLSGLNARLTPSNPRPGAGIDPSTPPRESTAPKPTNEKSTAELKADLARFGPSFAAELDANR